MFLSYCAVHEYTLSNVDIYSAQEQTELLLMILVGKKRLYPPYKSSP